jgi:SHS2 domain-containing protein
MAGRAWEHFQHKGDVGIRGFGPSRAAAFEEAARALFAVTAELGQIWPRERVEIACAAPDDELLLVDWLNALIYESATRHMLFSRFEVSITDGRLHGFALGEPIDPTRHELGTEIKGATMTELKVAHSSGSWTAQCVVDV